MGGGDDVAPGPALGNGLEDLEPDVAGADGAQPMEVHLREVEERARVPLLRRQRKVLERQWVAPLDAAQPGKVHRAQVELRLGVPAKKCTHDE